WATRRRPESEERHRPKPALWSRQPEAAKKVISRHPPCARGDQPQSSYCAAERLTIEEFNDMHSWLLRPRRKRPCGRRAEKRDELAALHSITSSARANSLGGTSKPSILAVQLLALRAHLNHGSNNP